MATQAVILAGGEGKRINPLGINKPKSMFEIMGKPLMHFAVENLKRVGITDIIIVTGPNHEMIHNYLADGSQLGLTIRYTTQHEPLGQADAILTTEALIQDPFFVLNANDIFDSTLFQNMMAQAEKEATDVVLAGREVKEPWRFGVMRFQGTRLVGVVEKPPKGEEPSQIAVVGLYYFSPEIFRLIRETPATTVDDQLERAYQKMIEAGKGTYVLYNDVFESYKYPWNLLAINDLLLQNIGGQQIDPSAVISERAIIGENVIIEQGVRIFENAIIRGPAYIGANSLIGNNVLVWGGCSLGPGCVIGFGSEIKHSVFGRNVWTHRAYVGDSIVSDDCSFGAGTITANWRFDEGNISVHVGGNPVDTGLDKLGIIMAEGCRTGSNSVLMPGVKIGPNSIVGPGVVLLDDLPPNKIALPKRDSYLVKENRLNLTQKSRDVLLDRVLQKTE